MLRNRGNGLEINTCKLIYKVVNFVCNMITEYSETWLFRAFAAYILISR